MNVPSFGPDHYVPVLKTKAGEMAALASLDAETRSRLTPLFDALPTDEDEQPEDRARKIVESLLTVSMPDECFWIDFRAAAGSPPDVEVASVVLRAAAGHGSRLPVVPVTAPGRPQSYQSVVASYTSQTGSGVALRLDPDEMSNSNVNGVIADLLRTVGVEMHNADLVLDIGSVPTDRVSFNARAVAGAISLLKDLGEYRTFTLASSAFPDNLSGQSANTTKRYPRADWELWRMVADSRGYRVPSYGDYGTESPALPTSTAFGPSPHIRYALDGEWVVVKGNKSEGHEGFYDVALELVGSGDFFGAPYSAGDRYADEKSRRQGGPGGPQQWRQAGTSHHLTHVVRQLGSLGAT